MSYPIDIIYYFLENLFSTRNLIHIGMTAGIPQGILPRIVSDYFPKVFININTRKIPVN